MKKVKLEINNLTKYYGSILGVKNMSLNLFQGEVLGFIGPNGSGKSTTIRCIMNLINKTSGNVLIDDIEFHNDDIDIKKTIGYLPSEVHLYEDYTVKDMLDFHEQYYDSSVNKRRKQLVKIFKIDETKIIENLSLGNSKKLGIVLAFMHNPDILILDEPTSGLDPIMQQVFYDLLREEKQKGTSIFYSTHILNEVSKICDRVGIIKGGELLKIESVEEIASKNLNLVTLKSTETDKIIKKLKLKEYTNTNNTLKFRNILPPDLLIKELSKFKLDKIIIEEAALEDILLHYYE